jgi:hypothetical protein
MEIRAEGCNPSVTLINAGMKVATSANVLQYSESKVGQSR